MKLSGSAGLLVVTTILVTTCVTIATAPAGAAGIASLSCAAIPTATPTATPAAPPLTSFTGVTPRRLVDTRDGTGGVDAPIGAGCVLRVRVDTSVAPVGASALSLSVTGLGSQPGFMSVFPCESGRPVASNLNTRDGGFPTPNLVVAVPDSARDICVFSLFEADVLIDLSGWWTQDGTQRFNSIAPVRVSDSRNDPGRARVPAGAIRTIELDDLVPSNTTAIVANLTVTEPAAAGFITAFPCGTTAPTASNLNFRAGEARAVAIIVGVDDASRLCLRSNVDHHVIVDISGYYSPAPQFGPAAEFRPLAGQRLADSRTGEGGWTTKFGSSSIRRLRPTVGLAIESQATAVVLNVVATQAEGQGFVTVYPCDEDVPTASVLNYAPEGESTNMVTVDLSATGEVCFFTLSAVHLVVDLFGVMAAPDDMLVERLSFDEFTWPPFTADGTDYIVECGNHAVDLGLDLLVSTTARVNGVSVSAGMIDLPVEDDDLTWLQLRRGGVVRDYWFRCVPDDFPRLEIDRPGEPTPGWYLTTLRTDPGQHTFAIVLDGRGAPIWYKRLSQVMIDLKRRSDGRLIITPSLGPRYGVLPDRGYQILSLTGTLIDEHTTIDDPADPGVEYPTDHHDYVPLTNGARAMLTYPLLADQDLRVLGTGYLEHDEIADGVIQEIDVDGNLVWSWRTSDHIGYDEVTYPVRWEPSPGYVGGEVDPFHLNSLGLVADGSGDYIVSGRHIDAVFRVERSSGDLEWILGSPLPATPQSGAPRLTILNDPLGGPRRPHDARMTGDVVTMFDNRTDTGQPARAVAYRVDTVAGTATLLWQIDEPQGRSSVGLGSARVQPDESVLVSWGGALQPMIEEYDVAHNLLMRITQVDGGVTYRAVKEPPASFSAAALRASAGGAAEAP